MKEQGGEKDKPGFRLENTSDSASPSAEAAADPVIDDLGDLPFSYGADTLFLVAQDPSWLFTYWDIDISRHPGGPSYLRVYRGEDTVESEIEVPFESRNWYVPVNQSGAFYTVEIGYYRGEDWRAISRSAPVSTPSNRLSESDDFEFANIPLHLSFHKLSENLQTAIRNGEPLMATLSRLQREGILDASLPELAAGQRYLLEALLGAEALAELTSGSWSGAEVESRVRAILEERLTSGGGASELLSSEVLQLIGVTSFGEMFSGSTTSSWEVGAISSWAASAISSWGAESSWTGESSWGASEFSSWAAALPSSWSEALASSGGIIALTSWLHAVQSSWFQAAQSSWSSAALSSWNQAALSSWTESVLSSWSGGSETLSSFGQSREFFMHVNAEVIFYGGTDPHAKVTIDGKPITLNPDGTFRYHFIFPDGRYEIPIVAASPDGVETRSAMLRFDRATNKVGVVTDTPQPPLGTPMGQQR